MRIIHSKSAFSLLELIIASILVIIVLMGIFAIDNVLNNNNMDYGQRYLVTSETQTTLDHILKNASLAIGSGTTLPTGADTGIFIGASSTHPIFCIHQDIPISPNSLDSTTVNNPPSTPANYTNTRWLCYSFLAFAPPAPYTHYEIIYCAFPYPTKGSCLSGIAPALGPTYLGTAQSITNPVNNAVNLPYFNPSSSTGFSITINNCLDNTQSTAACGTPNNPEVSLSGSVYPSQEGMQQTPQNEPES